MVKHELEAVLVRHLGPVKAPPELAWRASLSPGGTSAAPAAKAGQAKPHWLRRKASGEADVIGLQQPRRAGRVLRWVTGELVAAGVAAVAAVALLFLWFRPPSSDLHSTDPVQISAWLRSRSFDVPLRQDPPSVIRLTSARVKGSIAEIDYQVAGRGARLTVSPASATAPRAGAYHVVRSHLVRGQLFTLACAFPQDAPTACLLCHMGAQVN